MAGTYISHVIVPKDPTDPRACNQVGTDPNVSTAKASIEGGGNGCLYRAVKEEDVNVDLGDKFTPAIPPPDCVGDNHVIDQSTLTARSPFFGVAGANAPLCDKKLVVLQNQQNANADFHMMTNFPTDPNGTNPADTRIGDVQEPGRVLGISLNDLKFETDPNSILFGDNAPVSGLPVGIYTRYDTDPNHWRLFTTVTTSDVGTYEALLPSLETLNCPIPQGPCPGMCRFLVDDPGTPNRPNLNYNPGFVRGTDYIFDVWPGQTDGSLDTPMIPVTAGANCQTPSGNPELLQVSKPVVLSADSGATRRITIDGAAFGTTPGTVNLTDPRGTGASSTLGPVVNASPGAGGGLVSWSDTQIVIQVPATSVSFPAGQKQLLITENGQTTQNGITMHVLGSGTTRRSSTCRRGTTPHLHAIQDALDAGSPTQSAGAVPRHLRRERGHVEARQDPGRRPRWCPWSRESPSDHSRRPSILDQRVDHRRPLLRIRPGGLGCDGGGSRRSGHSQVSGCYDACRRDDGGRRPRPGQSPRRRTPFPTPLRRVSRRLASTVWA